VDEWLALWLGCHNGLKQWAWPDGEALLCQPMVAVEVFGVIKEILSEEAK
jgi:hypothetical protein